MNPTWSSFQLRLIAIQICLSVGLITLSITAVSAQTINLVCGGTMRQFEPERVEGTVSSSATTVDLAGKKLTTPVGEFRILKLDDTQLTFDAPRNTLVVFGTLDRLTGKMSISWRRPEEDAKLKAGQSAQGAMHAELICSIAQRLF